MCTMCAGSQKKVVKKIFLRRSSVVISFKSIIIFAVELFIP